MGCGAGAMSDMDPREAEMDSLLRRSMAAPVPRLSPDFHQLLSRELRRRSQPPNQFGRILFASYGGVSTVASIVVMRGQGLGWVAIGGDDSCSPSHARTGAPAATQAMENGSQIRARSGSAVLVPLQREEPLSRTQEVIWITPRRRVV